MEKQLIPKLRFPEFKGNWKENILDNIATFSKGKGISKADIDDNGKYECIRYGELYTVYSETINKVKSKTNLSSNELVFSEANDIIIPASGETQIDIATASCVLRTGIALGGDLNIIKTKANGVFLSYYLNNKKKHEIAKLSQGNSVVHLYGTQLKSLKINLPQPEEQQKIASFLTSVDERITLLTQQKEKLEQYKKGIMQQLFSQEIRFKDDNGNDFPEWEEKKLGDMIDLLVDNRGKTPPIENQGIPLIEINAINGKSVDYKKITKFVSEKTYKSWFRKYLKEGDILFSTVGQTAICSIYNEDIVAVIAQNIVGLRFSREDKTFMYYLLIEINNNNKFKKIEMGAVQPSVKVSQMVDLFFKVPSFKEQKKIADFLTAIDNQVELVGKQIDTTKDFKKGLLQQIFV